MRKIKAYLLFLLLFLTAAFMGGCQTGSSQPLDGQDSQIQEQDDSSPAVEKGQAAEVKVTEDGSYTSKEEVALYIHTFGHLPDNFLSKTKARKLGWVSKEGNLDEVAPGKSIGGSRFMDYDQQLPEKAGRTWTECDINYQGGYRGSERIIFSNDGLIYYTDDHYQTFTQLY